MVVIVTCKNEEDTIKNEGARVVTTLSIKGDVILTDYKLIQAFIVVLLFCKNEYDLFKMKH